MSQKLKYLLRSIANSGQKKICPYCGSKEVKKIDQKYVVTSLLKCRNCQLNFRYPKDSKGWLDNFYQDDYDIDTHMMTKLPSDQELEVLKKNNFESLKNYNPHITAIAGNNLSIVDYGCSWGYNVFKLNSEGHNVEGYELSRPRARFGVNKLGVTIHSSVEKLRSGNDVFFSSHVIEHLPDIKKLIDLSKKCLKEDGIFMAFCPNGGNEYRQREPNIWHVNWGLLHPNHLDAGFAQFVFQDNPYLILTGDWEYDLKTLKLWNGEDQVLSSKLDGKELLIIAKPNISLR